MPQSGAAASRFGKSPDGAVRSACGENFHGFHKDCFLDCKIEPPVYGLVRQARLLYASVRLCTLLHAGFAYQPPIQRQILHAAAKYSTVRTSKDGFENGIKNSRTECTACTAVLKSVSYFQYGGGLTTSMPTNPRTRLPPTWTLLVASTL